MADRLDALKAWTSRYCRLGENVDFSVKENRGTCLVTSTAKSAGDVVLEVPLELVLCEASVRTWLTRDAELSVHIENQLKNDRFACMIFLLCTTYGIGVWEGEGAKAWKEYMQFLPQMVGLPTELDPNDLWVVEGTSLEIPVVQKLQSLFQEWHSNLVESGFFSKANVTPGPDFQDWKHADALYRSRCLELPNLGGCMIPGLDMVNHAGKGEHNAFYELRDDRVCLVLASAIEAGGTEITINYGDSDKSILEFVYSYGFIEENVDIVSSLSFSLRPILNDEDDSEMKARWVGSTIIEYEKDEEDGKITFSSPLLPLLCVTPEEGLIIEEVNVPQEGSSSLIARWEGNIVESPASAIALLEASPRYPLFQSRAIAYAYTMVQGILSLGGERAERYESIDPSELAPGLVIGHQFRLIEGALLVEAEDFLSVELQKAQEHPVVVEYVSSQ